MEPTIHEIRALFLREFVKQIITNYPLGPETPLPSPPTLQPLEEPSLERIRLVPQSPTIIERQVVREVAEPKQTQGRRMVVEEGEYTTAGPSMIVAIQEIDEATPAQVPLGKGFIPVNQTPPRPKAPLLDQLDTWMADQTLESIECSGPDQKLIVKRNGSINQSTLQMTNEEIHDLVKELAERAHATLENGILKAETPAWSALAVISEFGGSRFLIQKKKR